MRMTEDPDCLAQCNGDSIGLTVDFNLGVRSISILCSNSTFCTSQSEQWMPCEFFHDAILSIRVFKRFECVMENM